MSTITTLSKSVLAGAIMLGAITPVMANYYEDDSDFNQTVSSLEKGWNWSYSTSAKNMAMDCTTDETSQEECGGFDGDTRSNDLAALNVTQENNLSTYNIFEVPPLQLTFRQVITPKPENSFPWQHTTIKFQDNVSS